MKVTGVGEEDFPVSPINDGVVRASGPGNTREGGVLRQSVVAKPYHSLRLQRDRAKLSWTI